MSDAGFGAEQQVSRKARRAARYRAEVARGAAVDEAALERLRRDQRNSAAGAEVSDWCTARARGSSAGALLVRLAAVAVLGFLAIRVPPALVSSAMPIGH